MIESVDAFFPSNLVESCRDATNYCGNYYYYLY